MSEASMQSVRMTVNGRPHTATIPVRKHLGDVLRQECGLTGTHLGCEHGVCGACTVLVDGRAMRACLMLGVQAEGADIVTIEGLALSPTELHPLQEEFCTHHSLQCGFCTPGMLTTLVEFLRDVPDPTETEVREAISGNLCRCTGYDTIVAATMAAAARMRAAA